MVVIPQTFQTEQAFMSSFQVGGEEMHVIGHKFKQGSRHFATEQGDIQIRILDGQIINDWHRHSDVAQSGEPYDEELFQRGFFP
jgi:hypothetical protein